MSLHTKESLDRLKEKKADLEEKRKHLMDQLCQERTNGRVKNDDLNSSLLNLLNEVGDCVREIESIEKEIEGAEIIECRQNSERIEIGSIVDIEFDEGIVERCVVGVHNGTNQSISEDAPIIDYLLGKKPGEEFMFPNGEGDIKVKIKRIFSVDIYN